MYHSTEYHREFWDVVRGKQRSGRYIESGRNVDNGSYRLPYESNEQFASVLKKENLFRQIATVVTAAHGDHTIWAHNDEPAVAWLNPQNNNGFHKNIPAFDRIRVTGHKLGSMIQVSEDLCNDAEFDLEGHVTKMFARSVGHAEEAALINGDGVDAPSGFLNDATIGHSTGEVTYDDVIRLYFSLDKEYRRNAVWIMNDETALKLRTLKDASGNYLWNHADNTIMGKPVHISNYMPDMAAGDKPIAFGDFSYLWIIDRIPFGMRRLNERFAVQQQVGFIGYEYIDAKLIRPDAVHVMQITE